MRLYLIRHAVAFDRDPAEWPDDAPRPLTPRGARRFERAARGVRAIAPRVDVLLTSPFERAWATAAILHRVAGWPAPTTCDALAAGVSAAAQAAALSECASADVVAAVGHEPDLHLLASYLLTGSEETLASAWRKGAIAALECPSGPVPGAATLLWFMQPSVLRAFAR